MTTQGVAKLAKAAGTDHHGMGVMMTDHEWQGQDADGWKTGGASRQPATGHEHIAAVIQGLCNLGMVKPGEQPAHVLHQYGCPAGQPPYPDACRCPGGPEMAFADWDEQSPERFRYVIPQRFYVRH